MPPVTTAVLQDQTEQHEEHVFNCKILDLEDSGAYENQEEEAVAVVEEPPVATKIPMIEPGNDALESNEASSSMDYSSVQVKTIHISSPILAAKSPYFYQLFSKVLRDVRWSEQEAARRHSHCNAYGFVCHDGHWMTPVVAAGSHH